MGNCCSGETATKNGSIETLDQAQLQKRMTARQLYLIIKCQAVMRGFLTRKKIRSMQFNVGMGGYVYGENGELQ